MTVTNATASVFSEKTFRKILATLKILFKFGTISSGMLSMTLIS